MVSFLFDLVKIILTIALLLGSVLLVIHFYFSRGKKPQGASLDVENQKIILPLRLQAYERIILFLERISPANLVMRVNKPEMNALQLQSALVKSIREEYEYNLSQQLYISPKAWEMVKNAKEETIRLINIAAGKTEENTHSAELVRILFELALEKDKLPVNLALDEVKKEIKKIF